MEQKSFFISLIFILLSFPFCNCLQVKKATTSFMAATITLLNININDNIETTFLNQHHHIRFPFSSSSIVNARNLPVDNGASNKLTGSVEALVPIVKMNNVVKDAYDILQKSSSSSSSSELLEIIKEIDKVLNSNLNLLLIPNKEPNFKKIFDEFSENISYKQRYLDSNAFLVYYTKGFDGPNRPSIETEDDVSSRMTSQFGYRNEIWINVDETRSEIEYLLSSSSLNLSTADLKDLKKYLQNALSNFDNYFKIIPTTNSGNNGDVYSLAKEMAK